MARAIGEPTDDYIAAVDKRVYFTREEAQHSDQLAHTRQRLARQVAGLERQKDRVASLLRPLTAGALALPSRREEREEVPIMECYEHIFRDWAWGAREVDQLRTLVERGLPEAAGAIAITAPAQDVWPPTSMRAGGPGGLTLSTSTRSRCSSRRR